MTAALPDELAPALRRRAEALLAACPPVEDRPDWEPEHGQPPRCYVCHRRDGKMTGHHPDRENRPNHVVPVHRACHRQLHRSTRGYPGLDPVVQRGYADGGQGTATP